MYGKAKKISFNGQLLAPYARILKYGTPKDAPKSPSRAKTRDERELLARAKRIEEYPVHIREWYWNEIKILMSMGQSVKDAKDYMFERYGI